MLLMIAVYGLGFEGGHLCSQVCHETSQDAYVMCYICAVITLT